MSRISQNRNLKSLAPIVEVMAKIGLSRAKKYGVDPLVVETLRTKERQKWLYAQGRTRPGPIVTWTLNSRHLTGIALDVVPQKKKGSGKIAIWDRKDPGYRLLSKAMKSVGFEWGGDWKNTKDYPHYQASGLKKGSKTIHRSNTNSTITKAIQKALNARNNAKLKVDGIWGNQTTKGVNRFRKKQHWKQDGKVGKYTFQRLMK